MRLTVYPHTYQRFILGRGCVYNCNLVCRGVCSFLGSVYSTAQELYMSGVQLDRTVAYKQEVYLTSVQDSLPLTDITSRCSVLHVKEYAACQYPSPEATSASSD